MAINKFWILDFGFWILSRLVNKTIQSLSWKDSKSKIQNLILILLCVFLLSCSSVRPVVKIGLIAPFEGLHRRTGYEALAAMRAAIEETPTQTFDILPLALDDSIGVERTAQKMLADPAIKAIIGPQTPADAERVKIVLQTSNRYTASDPLPYWLFPFAPSLPNGFTQLSTIGDGSTDWAIEMLRTIAQVEQRNKIQRLIIAGWRPGWPISSQLDAIDLSGFQFVIGDDLAQVQQNDAIFWAGSAEEGATYLTKLRRNFPQISFWMGAQGGDPVFTELATLDGPVYWATWSNSDYPEWAKRHTPSSPAAYLIYAATRQSILKLTSPSAQQAPIPFRSSVPWQLHCFQIQVDRTTTPFDPCHSQ